MSMRGFERGIKDARKQLKRDVTAQRTAIGVVAIDITKAIDTGGGIFLSLAEDEALRWLMKVSENLEAKHERIISGGASRQVAGALFYSAVPAAHLPRNIYALADRWEWRLVGATDPPRASAFRALVSGIQRGTGCSQFFR
jgi:hypothetical protein